MQFVIWIDPPQTMQIILFNHLFNNFFIFSVISVVLFLVISSSIKTTSRLISQGFQCFFHDVFEICRSFTLFLRIYPAKVLNFFQFLPKTSWTHKYNYKLPQLTNVSYRQHHFFKILIMKPNNFLMID